MLPDHTTGDLDQIRVLLPDDFDKKIFFALEPAIDKLLTNGNDFVEGLNVLNIRTIVEVLNTAKRWDQVFGQVRLCVETYSPDKRTEPMKTVLDVAPYRQMLELVSKKVSESKRAVLALDVSALLESQSDTLEDRRKFYGKLGHKFDVLADIEKLSGHFGVMRDAETIRCIHQKSIEHVQRVFESVYREAADELKNIQADNTADWRKFDVLYKNLIAFRETCGAHECLGSLELTIPDLSEAVNVKNADNQLYRDFLAFLNTQLKKCRRIVDAREAAKSAENLDAIVKQLIKFEKMAIDLPTFRKRILEEIDGLLSYCRRDRGIGYLQRIADKLKEAENGEGLMVIDNHGCFSGIAIAMRNQATSKQTITDVLDSLEESLTTEDVPEVIPEQDKKILREQYDTFKKIYDRLLGQYLLPELDFDKNRETLLAELKQSLSVLIEKLPKVTVSNVVWSSDIKAQIPEIMAYVFAIWTLRDSKAYFDAGGVLVENNRQSLKKPHPAQVIAIFRMTGVGLPDNQFDNHLVEILTGEGKSVCVAVVATVFALAGFEVKCACYSEIISKRDRKEFLEMFEFLGVAPYIRYGVFNKLYEEIINEQGDLREQVKNLVGINHPAPSPVNLREQSNSLALALNNPGFTPGGLVWPNGRGQASLAGTQEVPERYIPKLTHGVLGANLNNPGLTPGGLVRPNGRGQASLAGTQEVPERYIPKLTHRVLGANINHPAPSLVNRREQSNSLVLGINHPARSRVNPVALQFAESRPRVMVVDEVDVFFKKDFYGKLYRPFFLLKSEAITDLMNWIWQQHKNNKVLSVYTVKSSDFYRACCSQYPNFEFLIDSGIENLLRDLKFYRQEDGHEYLVEKCQIMYRYQDGTSARKTEGYKTIWAYYHEHENNKITDEQLAKQIGLIVNCGAFSYAEMLRDMGTFARIIGVTGTLKTLSSAEKAIIRDEFRIKRYSYIPSAYGLNKFVFEKNKGVKVEDDKDYHFTLLSEIKSHLMGSTHPDHFRPVMVFFSDMPAIEAFVRSLPEEMKSTVSIMNEASSSTVSERDADIKRATIAGKITLLTRALGRGTDFICYDRIVDANGGIHVIQTFLSKEVAEERQIQGRTARQAQKGSYSLVLRAQDLNEVYGVNAKQIEQMRANGIFYDNLHEIRCQKFEKEYQNLTKQIEKFQETCHEPSVNILQELSQQRDIQKATELLMKFNKPTSLKIAHSRTVILMDATGSMNSLINGVKVTVNKLFFGLKEILQKKALDPNCFEIQLCAYRNYEDGPNKMLQASPWSSKPAQLQTFMEGISASGGAMSLSGNEAVEIGLWHVNQEADNDQELGVTQAILIADMPPNTQEEVIKRRSITEGKYMWSRTRFSQHTFYKEEVDRLASRTPAIPVHSFYVKNDAKDKFTEIAKATGGETGSLEINSDTGSQRLVSLFAKRVVIDVTEDELLRAELLKDCSVTFGA